MIPNCLPEQEKSRLAAQISDLTTQISDGAVQEASSQQKKADLEAAVQRTTRENDAPREALQEKFRTGYPPTRGSHPSRL
jgi:hypothetical protein